ncbi:MAG: TIGR00730 family Rossman fold protein [Actinomycetota bacterium]
MRSYALGDPALDQRISELVADASGNDNADLVAEIITTALKFHRDNPSRGDLKLVNTALKEMRYSMLVFSRHDEPKVTMFGSARTPVGHPDYELSERFAAEMSKRDWGVITGAGPGIMEAGSKGAGMKHSYGVNIRLPFEADINSHISPERNVNFKYFFTRKLTFVKESHAFAIFPGGFGTLDEMFELLTLVQTGKSDLHPIVLLESEGSGYWASLLPVLREILVEGGYISPSDPDLLSVHSDPTAAADELCRFYANYHSQRYVDGLLILRLNQAPDEETLARLNEDYADIIAGEPLAVTGPTEAESADGDALDLDRVSLRFDRRSFGRLRRLVNELNDLVVTPAKVHPPAPMGEEQAERPW